MTRLNITVGNANDGRTEVLDGLGGGERVVVAPPADLRERQLVKVRE